MTPKGIIIHCSATYPDQNVTTEDIRRWHVEDNGWSDIGYNDVIERDGKIVKGRPLDKLGAHAKGYNDYIGICMVGGKARGVDNVSNFTAAQWEALDIVVFGYMEEYGFDKSDVMGHDEVSEKTCPNFDVRAYMEDY